MCIRIFCNFLLLTYHAISDLSRSLPLVLPVPLSSTAFREKKNLLIERVLRFASYTVACRLGLNTASAEGNVAHL